MRKTKNSQKSTDNYSSTTVYSTIVIALLYRQPASIVQQVLNDIRISPGAGVAMMQRVRGNLIV